MSSQKPVILLLGATGQVGRLVAQQLHSNSAVALRVTSRSMETVEKLKSEYGDAVYMDLDDPRTFVEALAGVQRAFLITGYSFSMVTQSKTFIDAAKRAGVQHIVHLGVFTKEWDCTDPHFVWHQMIEAYLNQSGIAWTNLHPNVFMQNITGNFKLLKEGVFHWGTDKPCGWIALEDVAAAAAEILAHPEHHRNKDYWFSTESLTANQVASVIAKVTGAQVTAQVHPPDFMITGMNPKEIDPYFLGVVEFLRQVSDGRMAYVGNVEDDMEKIFSRKGISFEKWATMHKEDISKQLH